MADDQKRIFKQKKLNTKLLEAVYSKDLEKVKKQLANESHPDTQCQISLVSSAHIAAYNGSVDILKELLKKNVNLTIRDERGLQPHHYAALNASLPCLKIILDKQSDLIDSPVMKTNTILSDDVSDSYGHNHNKLTTLIREEIEEGATALYIATEKRLADVVNELLERNAMVTGKILDLAKDQNELSTMLTIAQKKHPKMGDLQKAVFKGDVDKVKQCLQTIENEEHIEPTLLHLAVDNKLKKESNKHEYNEILMMLVETEGMDINHTGENKKTPLYLATERKWMDDIDWLLKNGAEEDIKCKNGETVFHVAARNKDSNILKYLLAAKPESKALKEKDDEGYTPLFRAIKSGCAHCVKALLETTSEDDYKTNDGELTILHAAIESSRNPDVILQKILEYLIKKNSSESISVLNEINSEGLTAVDLAAKKGEAKCLDVLFSCDHVDVIPKQIDKKEKHDTALHHAAKNGYYLTLQKLLDRDEDLINMLDSNGLSALTYAARGGHTKCVEILLKRGASLAVKGPSVGRTAVDIIMSNVPRAVEIIDDVLDSFIVPSNNAQLCKVVTESITENNNINEKIADQTMIPLLDSNNDEEQKEIHELNPSLDQVAIDMTTSNSTTAENNVHNSVASKINNVCSNNKQIPNQGESPQTNIGNDHENYKIHAVNLDYKCLVAGSRQLEVIEAVNECKNEKLKQKFFLHPLVKTFLIYKWKQIKNLHLMLFLVYLTHTLSVTGFALCTTLWQNFIVACICFILILITIIPVTLVEIVTWVQDTKMYSRFEMYIRWTSILLTGLYSIVNIFWQISYLASLTVLFSWMNLLLFYAMRSNGGYYIFLFFKIAKNVFQVLSLFFCLIFGFALSFYILFNGRKPFPDPFTAFGSVVAMISELKYHEAFENETDSTLIILGHILFVVFYVLVVMVMMNLIIGLSVNIVTEHEGKCKHLAMQGSFLSLVDKFFWDGEKNKFIIKMRELFKKINKQIGEQEKFSSLTILPNQQSKDNFFEKELIFEVMEIVNNKSKRCRPEIMVQKMNRVGEKVDEVLDMVHHRN